MPLTGRAVVAAGDGTFGLQELEVGSPGPDEVLVKLAASGVCHTDHDAFANWGVRLILGHEGAGTVLEVGSGATHVTPGDRVLLTWSIACGACFQCGLGNEVLCENLGLTRAGHARPEASLVGGEPIYRAFNLGTMSTHTVVRKEAVVPLPDAIPFQSACLLGCGVMTGVGSALNAAQVWPGASATVLGCGGVGLNAIQGCRIGGATTIVAVDVRPERLEAARRFGATHTVLAARDDAGLLRAADEVRGLTGGRGTDFAFECTAVPELAAAPLAMVHHGGVAIQVSGVEQEIAVDMRLFEWDKTYLNPLYGKCRPSRDFPRLFELHARGELLLDELVTRTYALEDAAQAFTDLAAGRNARGVLLI